MTVSLLLFIATRSCALRLNLNNGFRVVPRPGLHQGLMPLTPGKIPQVQMQYGYHNPGSADERRQARFFGPNSVPDAMMWTNATGVNDPRGAYASNTDRRQRVWDRMGRSGPPMGGPPMAGPQGGYPNANQMAQGLPQRPMQVNQRSAFDRHQARYYGPEVMWANASGMGNPNLEMGRQRPFIRFERGFSPGAMGRGTMAPGPMRDDMRYNARGMGDPSWAYDRRQRRGPVPGTAGPYQQAYGPNPQQYGYNQQGYQPGGYGSSVRDNILAQKGVGPYQGQYQIPNQQQYGYNRQRRGQQYPGNYPPMRYRQTPDQVRGDMLQSKAGGMGDPSWVDAQMQANSVRGRSAIASNQRARQQAARAKPVVDVGPEERAAWELEYERAQRLAAEKWPDAPTTPSAHTTPTTPSTPNTPSKPLSQLTPVGSPSAVAPAAPSPVQDFSTGEPTRDSDDSVFDLQELKGQQDVNELYAAYMAGRVDEQAFQELPFETQARGSPSAAMPITPSVGASLPQQLSPEAKRQLSREPPRQPFQEPGGPRDMYAEYAASRAAPPFDKQVFPQLPVDDVEQGGLGATVPMTSSVGESPLRHQAREHKVGPSASYAEYQASRADPFVDGQAFHELPVDGNGQGSLSPTAPMTSAMGESPLRQQSSEHEQGPRDMYAEYMASLEDKYGRPAPSVDEQVFQELPVDDNEQGGLSPTAPMTSAIGESPLQKQSREHKQGPSASYAEYVASRAAPPVDEQAFHQLPVDDNAQRGLSPTAPMTSAMGGSPLRQQSREHEQGPSALYAEYLASRVDPFVDEQARHEVPVDDSGQGSPSATVPMTLAMGDSQAREHRQGPSASYAEYLASRSNPFVDGQAFQEVPVDESGQGSPSVTAPLAPAGGETLMRQPSQERQQDGPVDLLAHSAYMASRAEPSVNPQAFHNLPVDDQARDSPSAAAEGQGSPNAAMAAAPLQASTREQTELHTGTGASVGIGEATRDSDATIADPSDVEWKWELPRPSHEQDIRNAEWYDEVIRAHVDDDGSPVVDDDFLDELKERQAKRLDARLQRRRAREQEQSGPSTAPLAAPLAVPLPLPVQTELHTGPGKGFGGGEATRNPDATFVDPSDPKARQQAIHKAESFAEYMARRQSS